MTLSHSTVTGSSLLPFATASGAMVPFGDDNISDRFDISGIFENGLTLGSQTFTDLRVSTNGEIRFGGDDWPRTHITAFDGDQDSRAQPAGVANPGIWIDLNQDRDSVVITWNGIGRYPEDISQVNTYQVEIIDRGGAAAEVIFRYDDMQWSGWGDGSLRFGDTSYNLPDGMGEAAGWDELEGNTGIDGVWQLRIENGALDMRDLATPGRNLQGTADGDSLAGWLGDDTLSGLAGHDTLDGSAGDDRIAGDAGDDLLQGGAGDDYLQAGDGDDSVTAGDGDDTVFGGDGNDLIQAQVQAGSDVAWGDNYFSGGAGDDSITGGRSYFTSDTILGGAGNDTLDGHNGRNMILGGDGDDLLSVGAGTGNWSGYYDRSVLSGDAGNDTITGGRGDDTIGGQDGADSIDGGNGDDFIFGGDGTDHATGGDGADRFFASTAENDVTVIGDYNPDEGDWLVLDGRDFSRDNLRLFGDRMTDLDGNPAEFRNLTLAYIGDDRSLEQTLFTFANASELDRLIIRLPLPEGESGETIYLDLF